MAKHQPERPGRRLRIKQREVEFSFWPTSRSTRRFGLQSRVFASEPWNLFEKSVYSDCPVAQRSQALAYLEQAKDFYNASRTASVSAAKPLLIYYALMNVVKTFGLTRGIVTDYGEHHHGLSSIFSTGSGPQGVKLKAHPSRPGKVNLFDLLLTAVSGSTFPLQAEYEIERIFAQILLGHRLWCDASGTKERFIEIEAVNFRESKNRKEAWIRFDVKRTEHIRLGYTQKKLIFDARLGRKWHTVIGKSQSDQLLRFETLTPMSYTDRASDVINAVVDDVRFNFWRSITIVPPFRKYYIYVADQADPLMPQICSIYMIFFYLGAITRYRPHFFDEIISREYGAFIQEFIQNQPNQWLYMMASEMAQQEVTRAAVV